MVSLRICSDNEDGAPSRSPTTERGNERQGHDHDDSMVNGTVNLNGHGHTNGHSNGDEPSLPAAQVASPSLFLRNHPQVPADIGEEWRTLPEETRLQTQGLQIHLDNFLRPSFSFRISSRDQVTQWTNVAEENTSVSPTHQDSMNQILEGEGDEGKNENSHQEMLQKWP
ncbi:hypothetical protein BX616_007110 [Lobosporangium transversale]|uniref:Uncharacterized protein n=1 Tax=Lobosporangium transversale TaxID=64571 RepID=A0A1Y2G9X1_9FUNG|nr:hypothetical protein BCR41DRAFT_389751 [Lobosporangium transversale]KAF9896612.1 hypothetical protein BX616_007110 [Lobosporangium transversale]ORZ04983.1 hypothetical protein BCR41DRAFT_389751 [Lobosporangium transversale]|eukprot:XP_021876847.1 hypothetical protein BCR41DRAFT_389751 [Lobosporangium transversale]